jgi:hypothetical protein
MMKQGPSLAVLSLLVATPAAATVPLNVAVGAGARAVVGDSDVAFSGQFSAPWGGPVSLDIGWVAVAGDDSYSVTSTISVEAVWLSAESGTLELNSARAVAGESATPVTIFAGTNNAPLIDDFPANWFYEFMATGNGFFQGSYEVSATGVTFGLLPVFLRELGSGTSLTLGDFFDPTGAGSFASRWLPDRPTGS